MTTIPNLKHQWRAKLQNIKQQMLDIRDESSSVIKQAETHDLDYFFDYVQLACEMVDNSINELPV